MGGGLAAKTAGIQASTAPMVTSGVESDATTAGKTLLPVDTGLVPEPLPDVTWHAPYHGTEFALVGTVLVLEGLYCNSYATVGQEKTIARCL